MFSGAAVCCLLTSNYLDWQYIQLLGAWRIGVVLKSWQTPLHRPASNYS